MSQELLTEPMIEASAEPTNPLVQSPLFLQTLTHRLSPFVYNIFLLGLIPIAFIADVHTSSIWQQHLLGVGAWIILIVATRFSPKSERTQVWAMVAVSTCVEVWSSVVWGIYRYRYHNVPMFVPPGHGLVYLFP